MFLVCWGTSIGKSWVFWGTKIGKHGCVPCLLRYNYSIGKSWVCWGTKIGKHGCVPCLLRYKNRNPRLCSYCSKSMLIFLFSQSHSGLKSPLIEKTLFCEKSKSLFKFFLFPQIFISNVLSIVNKVLVPKTWPKKLYKICLY